MAVASPALCRPGVCPGGLTATGGLDKFSPPRFLAFGGPVSCSLQGCGAFGLVGGEDKPPLGPGVAVDSLSGGT